MLWELVQYITAANAQDYLWSKTDFLISQSKLATVYWRGGQLYNLQV